MPNMIRFRFFISVAVFLTSVFCIPAISFGDGDHSVKPSDEVLLSIPPKSIAQWYKPKNDRQVWLHTMFKLRQSTQAIALYAKQNNLEKLKQWGATLDETHLKVNEMVPEWQDAKRDAGIKRLVTLSSAGDIASIPPVLKDVQKSCHSCHDQWEAVVAVTYRSPDYSDMKLKWEGGEEQSYHDVMNVLADTIGLIKIGREDDDLPMARNAVDRLSEQMSLLGDSCENCHSDSESKERILGKKTEETMVLLKKSLTVPHDKSESGKYLGTVGFSVCGRCHGIHKMMSGVRKQITSD